MLDDDTFRMHAPTEQREGQSPKRDARSVQIRRGGCCPLRGFHHRACREDPDRWRAESPLSLV